MTKKEIGILPKFFDRYINLSAENEDLLKNLKAFAPEQILPDLKILNNIGNKVYEPQKWTVKDILQHCIDTERIMAFRALCFARFDQNPLPGFDENAYANNTTASNRSIEDLVDELIIVRKSSIYLFQSFTEKMLTHIGIANGSEISPLALGFVIVGHLKHHVKIINERYLPLTA
jgi:hypothetical protein